LHVILSRIFLYYVITKCRIFPRACPTGAVADVISDMMPGSTRGAIRRYTSYPSSPQNTLSLSTMALIAAIDVLLTIEPIPASLLSSHNNYTI